MRKKKGVGIMYFKSMIEVNGKFYPSFADENGKTITERQMFINGTRITSKDESHGIPITLLYCVWEQEGSILRVAVEKNTLINPKRIGLILPPSDISSVAFSDDVDVFLKSKISEADIEVEFEEYLISSVEPVISEN